MNGKLKKSIGFSLMPFAFLFLFEPRYTLVDPLPDFIGYILLCAAIINLADISPRIYEAFLGFRRAILVSLLKYVALYMLYSFVSESAATAPVYDGTDEWVVGAFHESEMAVGILLFVFVFGLFEMVVLIPAYRSFFEGMLSLGTYNDGTAIYLKKITKREKIDKKTGRKTVFVRESKRNLTEKAYFLTAFMIFSQIIGNILPELTTLGTNTSSEFIVHMRILLIVLILPVSITWLIKMLGYCARVRKDTVFIDNLSQKYVSYSSQNPDLYTVRRLVTGISTLIVASALCLNLYVNDVKVIPTYLFGITVILFAITLRKHSKKWISVTAAAALNAILSAILHFATKKFYSYTSLSNLEAYNAYNVLVGLSIAESVLFVLSFIFTLVMVWDIYKKHTDICFSRQQKSYKEEKAHFIKGTVACVLATVFMALANVYYVYANHPYFITNVKWVVEYSSVIVLGISLVFIGVLIYNLGNVINSIKCHYKLDI
ncbi:MAG: hypothetical protein E7592_02250 [Ruminococcaceae bacterium]|nr:hypothetical protein [Oscillospiraceae bacterium]